MSIPRLPGVVRAATTAPAVRASVDVNTVAQQFNFEWAVHQEDFTDQDTYWWWACSIRVDPDEVIADDGEGNLWSIPFSTDGEDGVTFGTPTQVRQTFVPVAASDGAAATEVVGRRRQRVLAAALDRPEKPAPPNPAASAANTERNTMDEAVRRALAAEHGLDPDTATEDEVNAAAAAAAVTATAAELAAAQSPAAPVVETPAPVAPAVETPAPVAASTPAAPAAGTVLVDEARLAVLEGDFASRLEEDRDRVLATALEEGRFAPSRREHYITAWEADPAGTRHLLTAAAADGGLAPNTVPVKERSTSTSAAAQSDSLQRVLATIPQPRKAA